MSDQSPPREHDQLGWLMGEVDRLRAELEQARKERDEWKAEAADNYTKGKQLGAYLLQKADNQISAYREKLAQARKGADVSAFEELHLGEHLLRQEIARLRAELEQALRKQDDWKRHANLSDKGLASLKAELEQARELYADSMEGARQDVKDAVRDAQRYRDALERIARRLEEGGTWQEIVVAMMQIARDALAGDK